MSYNKNTINISSIPNMIITLKSTKSEYALTEIGRVKGMGLNDDIDKTNQDFDGNYILNKLEYKNADNEKITIIEQMRRTYDCDSDDIIVSYIVDNPNDYLIEIFIHDDDFDCADNCSCNIRNILLPNR